MFEVLEHTADVGVVASGRDTPEAFTEAARGLFTIILGDLASVREGEIRHVEVTAPDEEALLVAWLNELLFLLDVEGFLFRRAEVADISRTSLRATVYGEVFDPDRHAVDTLIKGTTYHRLRIQHDEGGCRATVIFDI